MTTTEFIEKHYPRKILEFFLKREEYPNRLRKIAESMQKTMDNSHVEFESDLNILINDEIERRIYEAEKGIDKRIKQGLYTNTDGYPENVFKLGFYFLKHELLKSKE